jgi:ABC-2 type transport system ATP-binding protein
VGSSNPIDESTAHAEAERSLKAHSAPATSRLEVRDLKLSLGGRVILEGVSLSVAPGEILGILGPNGSGKTSLMRCITGLWRPDHGSVWLDGALLDHRGRARRADIGVVFQEPSLDIKLTARENLILGAKLFGIGGREAARRADELLAFMELTDRKNDKVETFSGGMKRRLELARALASEPTALLMDEPTNGLDPIAFETTWQRFIALRKARDLSLLISTHRTDEAARCDRLLVFDRGRVVTSDTPENILGEIVGDVIVLETSYGEDLMTELHERFEVTPQLGRDEVLLRVERGHELIPRLVEAFPPGVFRSISLRKPSLADAFLQLTGHSLDDDEGGA